MAQEKSVDPSWKGVIKWGGLSLIASGAIALLFFVLVIVTQQTLPVPAEEALENPLGPSALFTLAIIGEVLLLPSGLALYFSLRGVKKTAMFIATALWVLCVPMFMASRGQILAISQIGKGKGDLRKAVSVIVKEVPIIFPIIGVILTAIWQFYIGFKLCKLGNV